MKGLSLKQPFGTLIVKGIKNYETRVAKSSACKTKYRGDLLICTSMLMHPYWDTYMTKLFPDKTFKRIAMEHWHDTFLPDDWMAGPGMIIGMATLVAVGPMTEEHQLGACVDVYPTATVMKMENPMELVTPIPLKGLTNGFHLGIFDVNIEKESLIFK